MSDRFHVTNGCRNVLCVTPAVPCVVIQKQGFRVWLCATEWEGICVRASVSVNVCMCVCVWGWGIGACLWCVCTTRYFFCIICTAQLLSSGRWTKKNSSLFCWQVWFATSPEKRKKKKKNWAFYGGGCLRLHLWVGAFSTCMQVSSSFSVGQQTEDTGHSQNRDTRQFKQPNVTSGTERKEKKANPMHAICHTPKYDSQSLAVLPGLRSVPGVTFGAETVRCLDCGARITTCDFRC